MFSGVNSESADAKTTIAER